MSDAIKIAIVGITAIGADQLSALLLKKTSLSRQYLGFGYQYVDPDEIIDSEEEVPPPTIVPSALVNRTRQAFNKYEQAFERLTTGSTVMVSDEAVLKAGFKDEHLTKSDIRLEYLHTPRSIVTNLQHPARNWFSGIPTSAIANGPHAYSDYISARNKLINTQANPMGTNLTLTVKEDAALLAAKKSSGPHRILKSVVDYWFPNELKMFTNPRRANFNNIPQ